MHSQTVEIAKVGRQVRDIVHYSDVEKRRRRPRGICRLDNSRLEMITIAAVGRFSHGSLANALSTMTIFPLI